MIPHIRSGEVVELEGIAFTEVAAGDVILARRPDGVYVLHRVARLDDGRAYLVSDAGR
ncbi:MAG: peptidase S24, partial [Armatimonadetes bacterium]|nr:peptidase S24 [Armatimonadota bacterium]